MIRLVGECFKPCEEDEDYELFKSLGLDEESYSLEIYFDLTGANILKSKFEIALNKGMAVIKVDESSFLEKGQIINEFEIVSKKWPYSGKMFELNYSSKTLILKMDSEVLEGVIKGFHDCIEGGDFIPPEICDADYKDTEISIYGIFMPQI